MQNKKKRNLVFLLSLFVILTVSVGATTVKLQVPDTENLGDTCTFFADPDTNYDGSTLYMGNSDGGVESYLKFNKSVSVGQTIINATLNIYVYDNTYDATETPYIFVYEVSNQTWVETEITYNSKPDVGELTNSTQVDDVYTGWVVFNVTSWVVESNANENISFYINATEYGDGDYIVAYDREHATESLRPYLNITYEEPSSPDVTPPDIIWNTPTNNSVTQNQSWIYWNATISETGGSAILNVNGTTNYTMTWDGNYSYLNLTGLTNQTTYCGQVYANDTTGNMNLSSSRCVTINLTSYIPDITPPNITIVLPLNVTYYSVTVSLNVSANESVDTWWYNLNSGTNTTFIPNTTLTAQEGSNTLVVYVNDSSGNVGSSIVVFRRGLLDCNSCGSCSSKISSALSGDVVQLNSSFSITLGDMDEYCLVGCIGFRSVQNLTFEGNSFFINTSGQSDIAGLILEDSTNVTVQNLTIFNNLGSGTHGIHLCSANNNTLVNLTTFMNTYGVSYTYSNYNTLYNSNLSYNQYGVKLRDTTEQVLYNLFYNNLFNSTTEDVHISSEGTLMGNVVNYWNTTKTTVTNIIGGTYIGGNFYFKDYSTTCFDGNNDGLCDSTFTVATNNLDYLAYHGSANFGTATSKINLTGLTSYSFTVPSNFMELVNVTTKVTGNNENTTINFTTSGDLANSSRFIVTGLPDEMMLGDEGSNNTQINITKNDTLDVGTYYGWINWTNENNTANNGSISFTIYYATDAADIKFVNSTFAVALSYGGSTNLSFAFWNNGVYNATDCNISYSSSIGSMSSASSEFVVSAIENVTVSVTFTGSSSGTDSSAGLTITCKSYTGSETDSDTILGVIAVALPGTPPGGGSGGSDDDEAVCGNGYCEYFAGEDIETCPEDCTLPASNFTLLVSPDRISRVTTANFTYHEWIDVKNPSADSVVVKVFATCTVNDESCTWITFLPENSTEEVTTLFVTVSPGSELMPSRYPVHVIMRTPENISIQTYQANLIFESQGLKLSVPFVLKPFGDLFGIWGWFWQTAVDVGSIKLLGPFVRSFPIIGRAFLLWHLVALVLVIVIPVSVSMKLYGRGKKKQQGMWR